MILVIVPAALAELNAATAFYISSAGPNLGRLLVSEFERTANLILTNPGIGSPIRGALRRVTLRRFPYSVIYQVAPNELRVLALAHQRRRPGYWRDRT